MRDDRVKRILKRGAVAFGALATAGALAVALLGFTGVTAEDAEPLPLPDDGFSHRALDRTLRAHVTDGGVDYAALARERTDLRRYLATLARVGPESTPARFSTDDARLAYYVNAYNALVLLAVAQRWPIESVHDVRGVIEPTPGFGFFYGLVFRLDRAWINLWDLEHAILRERFEDARVHAAIVCASASCPDLRAEAYDPARLDAQLDAAMRAFVASDEHVRVIGRRVVLSAIFDWFADDFARDARRMGTGDDALGYVIAFAEGEKRAALERARAEGWPVEHADYDWSVNAAEGRGG